MNIGDVERVIEVVPLSEPQEIPEPESQPEREPSPEHLPQEEPVHV